MEIPPANGGPADDTVLLYGHLDKQPELYGWREGLGPWEPVIEGDRLYGRGGADDGYSTFASLTAIEAAQAAGFPHARCVVLIEASEESGSRDLPAHIEALAPTDRQPEPGDLPRLGLRRLRPPVDHDVAARPARRRAAGRRALRRASTPVTPAASCPSTFRIARQILSRIEDEQTGEIVLSDLHVEIPAGPHRGTARHREGARPRRSPR